MSRLVASFDPSAGSGTFQAGAVNKCSTLWVMNESPNFISLDFGGAGTTKIVQPWYNMQISLPNPVQTVNWSVLATLQSGSAPVSMVYVELFDPAETVSSLLSGPLFRQSNVGNAAAVSASASAVQNDGNAANTTILEGTPSGAASSQALITNDGRAILGGGNVTISAAGVFATPAGAIPGASISGAVPEAQSLNNQVTSSDNGTAQLYSTVDGRGIALGYKDSGGAYHQVLTVNPDGTVSAPNFVANIAQYLAAGSGVAGFQAVDDATNGHTRLEPSGDRDTILTYRDGTGTSHDVLQLSSGGITALGGLAFQGNISGSAASLANGNGTAASAAYGGTAPSHMFLSLAQGGGIGGLAFVSGSGSATVNHGLSLTPLGVVVNTHNGSNSTTFGSGSYTSTTVYVYQYSAQPWVGVVYV